MDQIPVSGKQWYTKIIAQKKKYNLSIRMNTKEDWTYGYFEAD